ncbi:MAG: diguanylate cyclase [Pseudomonadota bacterium]|nr:diguanylate cyclase [Pseudomonadota bacterium]
MKTRLSDFVDFENVVANLSTFGIVVIDRRFNVVLWNRFMELNSNVRAENVLGKNLFDAFPELNRNWLEKKIRSCMILKAASFSSWEQRPYLFRFNASAVAAGEAEFMYQDASIFPVHDHKGEVQGVCIAVHDATRLVEVTGMLERTMDQALDLEESNRRDGLTGVFNRKFFDEQITQEIVNARRYNWPLTLAMIDVDHFKSINDTYGHSSGDEVLRRLAERLKSMVRSSDTLFRYGGEEFALILPHIALENASFLLNRLRKAIETMVVELEPAIQVSMTVSIGVAQLEDGLAPGQLVSRADEALYSSKRAGRNRVTCYVEADPDLPVADLPPPTTVT